MERTYIHTSGFPTQNTAEKFFKQNGEAFAYCVWQEIVTSKKRNGVLNSG
jgi:hypothetical protein